MTSMAFRDWRITRRGVAEAAALAAVVVFALLAAGQNLVDPIGINHDGAFNALYAIQVVQNAELKAYSPGHHGHYGQETGFHLLIAAWLLMVDDPVLALGLASCTVGIATLALTYCYVRRAFNPVAAIAATGLLAASGWHVMMMDSGWRLITVPLVMAAVLYLSTRAGLWHVALGLASAAALYTYEAGRVIPPVVGLWLLLNRTPLHLLSVVAGAMAVGALPLLLFAVDNPSMLVGRTRMLWNDASGELMFNLWKVLVAFYHSSEGDFFDSAPLLRDPLRFLFPAGLAVVMWRFWHPQHGLLLLFLFTGIALGVLSEPNANHMITALLPVCILGGIAVARLAAACRPAWVGGVVVALLLVLAGAVHAYEYMSPYQRDPNGFFPEATAVGRHAATVDGPLHIVAGNWPRDTLTLLTWRGGDPYQRRYTYHQSPATVPVENAAYIIEAGDWMEPAYHRVRPCAHTVDEIRRNDQLVAYVLHGDLSLPGCWTPGLGVRDG